MPLERCDEERTARSRQFVVAAWWPLLVLSDRDFFPVAGCEALAFEAPKNGIDRAARKIGFVQDVEAVSCAASECLQNHGCGLRQLHAANSTYVEFCEST